MGIMRYAAGCGGMLARIGEDNGDARADHGRVDDGIASPSQC